MDDVVIDVEGLAKSFGKRAAVKGLSLKVKRGEVFGFLGPNGSGKTTSIRMLCGLLTPDRGSGTCLGRDVVKDSREIRREVGYMTQKFGWYEDLSVRENLEFVATVYEVRDVEAVVDRTIRELGLENRQDQLVGGLSGGWKQRLALAACLMHGPRLLLLDEPTAGVDPRARREFWDQILRLASEGVTVLVSTHYMDEAERCSRLAYIAFGELLAEGTAEELRAKFDVERLEDVFIRVMQSAES
ncbi:MAG TPA: ABC transporter ATP-binding protein, partial [Nevskiaceae bacterium]|nr:ABC transporter ATP-binding protein [Nevskiaceae bacterium]